MRRILLTVAYDGTNYFGWQKQKDEMVPTAEGALTDACRRLFRDDTLTLIGASRTDRGVHALGQRAVADVESSIPAEKIPLAIRPYLPLDIAVIHAREVSPSFHPRYDCIKKTYQYKIWNAGYKNPLVRNYSEWIYGNLDILNMEKAAKGFIGTHDFQAFCASGSNVSSTVRTIFDCSVKKNGDFVEIYVTGDGFLYNMVRIIAGTLIEIGLLKKKPEDIPAMIASKKRENAGPTAGPSGLTLLNIAYANDCIDEMYDI